MNNENKTYPWNGLLAIINLPIFIGCIFGVFVLLMIELTRFIIKDMVIAYYNSIKTKPYRKWEIMNKIYKLNFK